LGKQVSFFDPKNVSIPVAVSVFPDDIEEESKECLDHWMLLPVEERLKAHVLGYVKTMSKR
jgi:hypothetical protein